MTKTEMNSGQDKPVKLKTLSSTRCFDTIAEFLGTPEQDGYLQIAKESSLGQMKCFTFAPSGGDAPGDALCEPREIFLPPTYWYRQSDVRINFPLHTMWLADGTRISDLSIYNNEIPKHIADQRPLEVKGEFTVVTNNNFMNYAHWMTECLPGLYAAKRFGMAEDRILLPTNVLPFHRPSSHALGVDLQKSPAIAAATLRVERLNFLSFADHSRGRNIAWPFVLGEIADRLRKWSARVADPGTNNPKLVYVSRQSASRRRCDNEAKFEHLLGALGFTTVVLETLSLDAQIALFAEADAVIALHGAALANVMFCRPECLVIEIQPAAARSSHFLRLSKQFGLRYSVFRQSGRWDESPHVSWTLDLDRAMEFIRDTLRLAGVALGEARIFPRMAYRAAEVA